MLKRFFDRLRAGPAPQEPLYDSIVAAARQPRLYAEWGVPDTPAGRIEMVAVHTAIVTHALMARGPEAEDRARAISERFVTDMDDNMREIGVGDLTVPRKVKKAAAAVYDRVGLIDQVARGSSVAESVRLAETLVELDAGGDNLDRHALGLYFSTLIKRLADFDDNQMIGADAVVPLIVDQI